MYLACWLSVLCGQHTGIGYTAHAQTFQTNVFMPVLRTSTADCFHSVPLSVTLVLVGGHKISTEHNLLASFSYTLFLAYQSEI